MVLFPRWRRKHLLALLCHGTYRKSWTWSEGNDSIFGERAGAKRGDLLQWDPSVSRPPQLPPIRFGHNPVLLAWWLPKVVPVALNLGRGKEQQQTLQWPNRTPKHRLLVPAGLLFKKALWGCKVWGGFVPCYQPSVTTQQQVIRAQKSDPLTGYQLSGDGLSKKRRLPKSEQLISYCNATNSLPSLKRCCDTPLETACSSVDY